MMLFFSMMLPVSMTVSARKESGVRLVPSREAHVLSWPEPSNVKSSSQKMRRLDEGCGEVEYFTIAADTDTRYGSHEGSYAKPMKASSGCSFTVELNPGKHFYTSISGFRQPNANGNQPMIQYSWSVNGESTETPLFMLSFRGIPTISEVDIPDGYDWYYWGLNPEGTVLFQEDDENIDYYNCYGACSYERDGLEETCGACGIDLRSRFDDLYITLTAYSATEPIVVTVSYELVYNYDFILPAELQVVKDIYTTMCQDWEAPADWVWENYQVINSEERGERDTRRKPYCDWMPSVEVESLTTEDCRFIPGIVCDSEGHVSEIVLDTKGLRGEFPESFAILEYLTHVEVPSNQIEGSLPTHLFGLEKIKHIDLSHNNLVGSIPCPNTESQLKELVLSSNFLTGGLPACLFESLSELVTLRIGRNMLQGVIPDEIGLSTKLSGLYLDNLGLTGTLDPLKSLSSLSTLDLSHNYISDQIDAEFLEAFPRLYHLDLSWNLFDGSLPKFENINLRRVHLSHNQFSGNITDQFNTFASQQDRGVLSELNLDDNEFCGELSEIFYELLLDAHYFVYSLDVSNNHFRCSKENGNTFFANWAQVLDHDFGKCIPVPELTSLENDVLVQAASSAVIYINGKFTPSAQGTCRFEYANRDTAIVPALFESSARVACILPSDAPSGEATVTVASYCDDYASVDTINNFEAMSFEIIPETQPPTVVRSSSSKKSKTDQASIIGGSVAAVVALIFLFCICFILGRERQGKPIFTPNKVQERNPMHSDTADTYEGIDLEIVGDKEVFSVEEHKA